MPQVELQAELNAVAFAGKHVLEHPLGHVSFVVVTVAASLEVRLARHVSIEFFVVLDHSASELIVQAGHGLLLGQVGIGQSVADDAADMVFVFGEHDLAPQPGGGDRRTQSTGRRSYDDNVGLDGFHVLGLRGVRRL